jgi:hypothetical protein
MLVERERKNGRVVSVWLDQRRRIDRTTFDQVVLQPVPR